MSKQCPAGRSRSSSALFLAEVERYIKANDMSPTAFGRRAVNDPNLVFALREGRNPTLSVVDKALAFMAKHDRHGTFAITVFEKR